MIKWLSTSTLAFASLKLAGWACASLKNLNPPCRLPPSLPLYLPSAVCLSPHRTFAAQLRYVPSFAVSPEVVQGAALMLLEPA